MLKPFILSCFLLLTNCCVLNAQENNKDSLHIEFLNTQAEKVGEANPNEALKLLSEAENLGRKKKLQLSLARTLYLKCNHLFSQMQYEEVIANCKEAAKIFNNKGLIRDEVKCYNYIGLSYLYMNNFQPALKYFFKGLAIVNSINDEILISKINNNIGLVYESLEDWDSALKYAQISLVYKQKTKDKKAIASTLGNIANLYYYQSKGREALPYFRQAKGLYEEIGDEYKLAINSADMANTFADLGELDSAILYFNQALKYQAPRKEQLSFEYCISIAGIASAWLKKGNIKETEFYLKECNECEEVIPVFGYLRGLYSMKALYYKKVGNYAQSVKFLELSRDAQDSITKETKNIENQRIAINFEFAQKAKEDSLKYQLKISQQQSKAEAYKSRMYFAIAIGILLLAIAAFIVFKLRINQKNKRRKELEEMRNNIAGDLHDDVGSTLSSIQIISAMALKNCHDDPKLQTALSNISSMSDKIANGIKEIVWSVNPANDNLGALCNHLQKQASEFLDPVGINFLFTQELYNPKVSILPNIRKDIILIFKEALANICKYSQSVQVDIKIIQTKQKVLIIELKDYGCGFDVKGVKRGNGLNNMERRAAQINGKLNIESTQSNGTIIELSVEIP